MNIAVDVLGSPSLIVFTVSVDVKQTLNTSGPQLRSFSGSPGGRPGSPSLVSWWSPWTHSNIRRRRRRQDFAVPAAPPPAPPPPPPPPPPCLSLYVYDSLFTNGKRYGKRYIRFPLVKSEPAWPHPEELELEEKRSNPLSRY